MSDVSIDSNHRKYRNLINEFPASVQSFRKKDNQTPEKSKENLNKRKVSKTKVSSPALLSHRAKERLRHQGLNMLIKDICRLIPGSELIENESKIDKLLYIVEYITYLELEIENLSNQLNFNISVLYKCVSNNLHLLTEDMKFNIDLESINSLQFQESKDSDKLKCISNLEKTEQESQNTELASKINDWELQNTEQKVQIVEQKPQRTKQKVKKAQRTEQKAQTVTSSTAASRSPTSNVTNETKLPLTFRSARLKRKMCPCCQDNHKRHKSRHTSFKDEFESVNQLSFRRDLKLEEDEKVCESISIPPNKFDHRKITWMNGFMVFAKLNRKQFIRDNPKIHTATISKLMGTFWNQMSDEEKQPYQAKASEYCRELEDLILPQKTMEHPPKDIIPMNINASLGSCDSQLMNIAACNLNSNSQLKDTAACSITFDSELMNTATYDVKSDLQFMDTYACSLKSNSELINTAAYSVKSASQFTDSVACNLNSNSQLKDTATCSIKSDSQLMDNATCSLKSNSELINTAAYSLKSDSQFIDSVACNLNSKSQLKDTAACSIKSDSQLMDNATCNIKSDSQFMDTDACSLKSNSELINTAAYSVKSDSQFIDSVACNLNSNSQLNTATCSIKSDSQLMHNATCSINSDLQFMNTNSGSLKSDSQLMDNVACSITGKSISELMDPVVLSLNTID